MTRPSPLDLTTEIFTALKRVAPEIDPRTIDRRAVLVETLDIDSMDFLNFLEALCKRLDLDIPEADYPKIRCIDDLVGYLSMRMKTPPGV